MLVRVLFSLLSLAIASNVVAQVQEFQRLNFPVNLNGKTLQYPFAGGLNAPQFSAADLNNDKILDLVVFDRAGDVFLTFLNEGTPNESSYRYAPEYACNFPPLQDYVLFRDYDQDGAADIFCASLPTSSQEVQVFRGYYENNVLKFKPFLFSYPGCPSCVREFIYYPSVVPGFWNNLFIADTDIPAVDDVDGDGDLDIVTFDGAAGGHIWLVQNMSVEKGFGLDSLHFEVTDRCWGLFYESGLAACECDLSPSPDSCVYGFSGPPVVDDRGDTRHPGSTVMTFDEEGDGDMELVLGDISFTCLNLLVNGGDADFAWMTEQDTGFPRYDTPVDIVIYPAAFYLDLNNDGKKDMVAASNNKFINEDRKGVWFYQNTASSGHTFQLETQSFLVGDMIDLGTATHPALVDVNADGLLDIVVGNYGFYTPGIAQNASLYLFRNTGTKESPKFELESTDWLGLSEFAPNDYDFYPTFGDLDNDQDLDLLVGSNGGALYYYRNVAGPGNPMVFQRDFDVMWVVMDVGSYSTPAIVDLDSDGLKDIVMGERNGNLNFFKNMGAPDNPAFNASPTYTKLGQVDARIFMSQTSDVGFSVPVFIQQPNGALLLVTGTQGGHLLAHTSVFASEDPYTLVSETWGNIDVGNRSAPAFGDLNDDGILEMVVGNLRGGLSVYKTELVDCSTTTTAVVPTLPKPAISPNPARNWVRVEWPVNQAVDWQAFDLLGRSVAQGTTPVGTFTIQVSDWPAGAYFLELQSAGSRIGRVKLLVE